MSRGGCVRRAATAVMHRLKGVYWPSSPLAPHHPPYLYSFSLASRFHIFLPYSFIYCFPSFLSFFFVTHFLRCSFLVTYFLSFIFSVFSYFSILSLFSLYIFCFLFFSFCTILLSLFPFYFTFTSASLFHSSFFPFLSLFQYFSSSISSSLSN